MSRNPFLNQVGSFQIEHSKLMEQIDYESQSLLKSGRFVQLMRQS